MGAAVAPCYHPQLQHPLTDADQRALIHPAKQEERRPEQAITVEFTPQASDPDTDGHARFLGRVSVQVPVHKSTPDGIFGARPTVAAVF